MTEHRARAFVLDRRPHRENDLRVVLLTEHGARVEAFALGAQRSRQRFVGGLSPLALYAVRYSTTARATRLDEAVVERVWPSISRGLRSQSSALAATGVARALAEPAPHDAALFLLLGELYGIAAESDDADLLGGRLARFTLEALAHSGHALVFDRCVRCDAPAPDTARVTVDPVAGGVVCRSCGGGPLTFTSAQRKTLRAVIAGDLDGAKGSLVRTVSRLVEGVSVDAAGTLAGVADLFDPR